jgi:hypothetical protein
MPNLFNIPASLAMGGPNVQAFRFPVPAGSIAGGVSTNIGVTLPEPWPDNEYTIAVAVADADISVASQTVVVGALNNITGTGFDVTLTNNDPVNPHTYDLHVIVIHD